MSTTINMVEYNPTHSARVNPRKGYPHPFVAAQNHSIRRLDGSLNYRNDHRSYPSNTSQKIVPQTTQTCSGLKARKRRLQQWFVRFSYIYYTPVPPEISNTLGIHHV